MKNIFMMLFLFVSLFAQEREFLKPEEAFQTNFIENKNDITFNIEIAKDIYVYKKRLKVIILDSNKVNIIDKINLPANDNFHDDEVYYDNLKIIIPYTLLSKYTNDNKLDIKVKFQGCSIHGLCYSPMSKTKSFTLENILKQSNDEQNTVNNNKEFSKEIKEEITENETDSITNSLKNGNILLVLATFFGFGLLLALTPCVFPMIPILSSIIVGASKNEKLTASRGFFLSLVYVLSMSLAYTMAGILAGLFGANLQAALQNPYVLTVFAFIFVALAFSMFGYFKLELPKSLQTKVNKLNKTSDGKDKQGIIGIAIMGFLSALIVGPCVAPPLAGALVYIGQTGDAILGGSALFVMSLGMGAPLLLIGLGAGKFMPRPGGWMDSITKIFGIVMLAIAIWMLDRVLEPILTMYLWALLFIGTYLYLKMYTHIITRLMSTVILIYGIIVFVGAVSGATNILKPLSMFTSSNTISVNTSKLKFTKVKSIQALNEAIKNSSKPVMLDFWATWCVSCKELDAITFKDKEVIKVLSKFTLLKADVTHNTEDDKALMKKYGIYGPPGLLFWDKNNKDINSAKIIGYKNAKEFITIVNKHFK